MTAQAGVGTTERAFGEAEVVVALGTSGAVRSAAEWVTPAAMRGAVPAVVDRADTASDPVAHIRIREPTEHVLAETEHSLTTGGQ